MVYYRLEFGINAWVICSLVRGYWRHFGKGGDVFRLYGRRLYNTLKWAFWVLLVANLVTYGWYMYKNPSSSWESQPNAKILVCGWEMDVPGVARNLSRSETEGFVFAEFRDKNALIQEGLDGSFGRPCFEELVYYTPGASYGEAQTHRGQKVVISEELMAEWRATGWRRQWWDTPHYWR